VERVVVKEVPVDRIVDKVVEKVVEKRVEVPVDRVVEVVKIVEVEKRVEVPVDRIVEVVKFVEVIVEKPVAFLKFGEAPILAQKVSAGKLEPVGQRLPEEPLVMPAQEIGKYGGTMRRAFKGPSDWPNYIRVSRTGLVRLSTDGSTIIPYIAKGWEATEEGRVWTFSLRKGMKWSDGAPFSADDFLFHFEDVILNDDLNPNRPSQLSVGGEFAKFEKVDDYTIRYTFTKSNYIFPTTVSQMDYGFPVMTNMLFTPAHYMKQFHIKYNPNADTLAKEQGFDSWTSLYKHKFDQAVNPEMPDVRPWILTNKHSAQKLIAERNPYYLAVDREGNQLPYVDRMTFTQFESAESLTLRAISGEIDFQGRHIAISDLTVLKENEAKGGYEVRLWPSDAPDATIIFNQSWQGPEAEYLQDKKFRQALSIAMDRNEINEISAMGLGVPRQLVPPSSHDHYPGDDYAFRYIEYDPDLANQWLDEILPNKDSDGFRLMSNGERLVVVVTTSTEIFGPIADMVEQVARYWETVGVKTSVDLVARSLLQTRNEANEAMVLGFSLGRLSTIFATPDETAPTLPRFYMGPAFGRWVFTSGREGIEPPEHFKNLLALHEKGVTVPPEESALIGQEIFRIHAENLWATVITGTSPMSSGVMIVNANLRNVPEFAGNSWNWRHPSTAFPETFFYQ